MSKNKQQRSAKSVTKSSKKASSNSTIPKVYPLPSSEQDGLYRKIFRFSVLGMLLVSILLSFGTGINGDDEYQVDYSEKLVDYYLTMGQDTSALYIEKGNMHYYGGFFDLTAGLVNRAAGLTPFDRAYHKVRHGLNAVMGMLAILFMGLFVRQIAGWRAAILAIWLMYLSPRFFGHSQMNPKDIPFAAGFAVSLYYMLKLLRSVPTVRWQNALGLALGIALALATRAGGLLLIAYLFLFAGIDFLYRYGLKNLGTRLKEVGYYLGWALAASVAGYILAVLTWPAALADPINHPLAALTEFSKFGVRIRLLFQGDNILSDATAWYYPIIWIAKTIPLYAVVGFAGGVLLLPRLLKRYYPTGVWLAVFATVFPVFYIIYKDSILYDGWRHLIFVYPSLVALAALFWIELEHFAKAQKTARYAVYGILGLMALEAAVFIVRNPHLSYVYFNPIGGGVSGAFGYYETDYWGVGVKDALDWMEQEGILGDDMKEELSIGTTFFFPLAWQARDSYGKKVTAEYVRFNTRYDKDWDYGIFPSRFIRGPHLQAGSWPTSRSIHTIKVNGVPMVTIEKNEDRYAYLGQQAIKERKWAEAVKQFKLEVEAYPDNEIAWVGLANAYLNTGQYEEALAAAQQALVVAPDVEVAILYEGLAYLNTSQLDQALQSFDHATRVNDEYFLAYYYKALIHQQKQRYRMAYEQAQKAIEANPRFKQAYQVAAQALQGLGDTENAQRYLDAASKL
jgi:tetratricopeptide (TPR) repeat protein